MQLVMGKKIERVDWESDKMLYSTYITRKRNGEL